MSTTDRAVRIAELRSELTDAIRSQRPPDASLVELNRALCELETECRVEAPTSFPIHALLPMTDICNARCRFCPYSPEVVAGWTTDLEAVRRLDWLKFLESVCFGVGFGEPFATKGLADILRHWRDAAPFARVWTTTNGSLIGPEHVQAMLGYVDRLVISLNAATSVTYERLMPPLRWARTLSNLERIRDEKRLRGTDKPKLTLSYVINVENANEAPDLPDLAVRLDADAIVWYHTAIHTSPHLDYLVPASHHLSSDPTLYDRVHAETRARCADLDISFSAPAPFGESPPQSAEFAFGVAGGVASCDMPWKYILGTNDTHMVQVCCGFASPHLPRFTWPTAEAFHREVWNTAPLRLMRRTMGRAGELPICTLCRCDDKNSPAARSRQIDALRASNDILGRAWAEQACDPVCRLAERRDM